MEDKELKFKTTLNCSNCVAKVQSELDQATGIVSWNVDTSNPDKILTVRGQGVSADDIIELIEDKGFDIQEI